MLLASVLVAGACRRRETSSETTSLADAVERGRKLDEAADRPPPTLDDGTPIIAADPREALGEAAPSQPTPPLGDLVRKPTSPDPEAGDFTLDEAVAGMSTDGKLVAEIRTDLGTVFCDLYADRAPRTVANFVGLARGTRPWWDPRTAAWVKRPFYDGTTFHRVIPEFMIQGGDTMGDGSGGVGYEFADEVHPSLEHDRAGRLCMANHGKNTNGGQFFITDAAAPHLDALESFTVFGQCEPTDVVAHIARVPQIGPPSNRPVTKVSIDAVRIHRASGGAGAFLARGKGAKSALEVPASRGAGAPPSVLRGRADPAH